MMIAAKCPKWRLILLLFVMSMCSFGYSDFVKILTSADFDETVAAQKMTLVKFYAPWCGHCKNMAPAFEAAAAELADTEGALLAKVDMTQPENKVFAERYGVRGYPTLKLFRGDPDAPEPYQGARTQESLVSVTRRILSGESQVDPALQEKERRAEEWKAKDEEKKRAKREEKRAKRKKEKKEKNTIDPEAMRLAHEKLLESKADSKFKTLTAANFDETVAAHKVAVVAFLYHPDIRSNLELSTNLLDAAEELAQTKDALVAEIDVSDPESKAITQRFSIMGYPSVTVFRGDPTEQPEVLKKGKKLDKESIIAVVRRQLAVHEEVHSEL